MLYTVTVTFGASASAYDIVTTIERALTWSQGNSDQCGVWECRQLQVCWVACFFWSLHRVGGLLQLNDMTITSVEYHADITAVASTGDVGHKYGLLPCINTRGQPLYTVAHNALFMCRVIRYSQCGIFV